VRRSRPKVFSDSRRVISDFGRLTIVRLFAVHPKNLVFVQSFSNVPSLYIYLFCLACIGFHCMLDLAFAWQRVCVGMPVQLIVYNARALLCERARASTVHVRARERSCMLPMRALRCNVQRSNPNKYVQSFLAWCEPAHVRCARAGVGSEDARLHDVPWRCVNNQLAVDLGTCWRVCVGMCSPWSASCWTQRLHDMAPRSACAAARARMRSRMASHIHE